MQFLPAVELLTILIIKILSLIVLKDILMELHQKKTNNTSFKFLKINSAKAKVNFSAKLVMYIQNSSQYINILR